MRDAPLDLDGIDWERTAFGLICPDAVVRHLGTSIVRRLGEAGFRPLAWRCLWQRPLELDAYFERNITQVWHAYLYRLADRVFEFGPTVALLLHDERPVDGVPTHQRLRAVKGSSEPARSTPGTIRADLGLINVTLGLMHSADSAEESRHEAEVYVGPGGWTAGQDPADLYAHLAALESMRPPERRGYDEVLAGLRARIVAVLWHGLPAAAREQADKLLAGGVAALAAPGAGARLADLMDEPHPLLPALRCEYLPGEPRLDTDRLRALLRAHGSDLDPWEDLVLATSMRFEPRRAS
ncbi:MAG TPA: nucleoside-diphosphate kinase [Pseudonocardiaceae bacterium]